MAGDHDNRRGLLQAYLIQADKRLAAAHALLAARSWEDAVSRAYYAAFHAVTAALASRGLEAKTHDGARTLFALHFVRTGLLPADVGRTVAALQRERQSGDYDPFPLIEEEAAREAVTQAEGVLGAIRLLLGEAEAPGG